MRTNYKQPLSIKEQIEYLENNKRVLYTIVSKEDAEKILLQHCYINVITPFKHHFAKIDPATGAPEKDGNGNHIYQRDVEFNEYYNYYQNERNSYPLIFRNIMNFETTFNSIISNEVINHYHINTFTKFLNFCNRLLSNSASMPIDEKVREHMQDEINKFYYTIKKYDDIFIFFDRISLSSLITIYRCCDQKIRNKIFKELKSFNMTFGYSSPGTFDDFLKRIVPIRNYVCHFNSLEVLINYYDIKNKQLRTNSDKKKYINVINKLSK